MSLSRSRLLALGAYIAVLGLAALFLRTPLTPSLPAGIYLRLPILGPLQRGEIVEFCLPDSAATLARVRSYVPSGSCTGNAAPLAKQIVAKPGDFVAHDENGYRTALNGVPVRRPQPFDSAGRPLAAFRFSGSLSGFWVVGRGTRSFDSRYYGPIERAHIRARLKLLWRWDSND